MKPAPYATLHAAGVPYRAAMRARIIAGAPKLYDDKGAVIAIQEDIIKKCSLFENKEHFPSIPQLHPAQPDQPIRHLLKSVQACLHRHDVLAGIEIDQR